MKTLKFHASPYHRLVIDPEKGEVVRGGESFEVSNERAHELLTHPRIEEVANSDNAKPKESATAADADQAPTAAEPDQDAPAEGHDSED